MFREPAPLPHERCDPNPPARTAGNTYLLYIRSGSGTAPAPPLGLPHLTADATTR